MLDSTSEHERLQWSTGPCIVYLNLPGSMLSQCPVHRIRLRARKCTHSAMLAERTLVWWQKQWYSVWCHSLRHQPSLLLRLILRKIVTTNFWNQLSHRSGKDMLTYCTICVICIPYLTIVVFYMSNNLDIGKWSYFSSIFTLSVYRQVLVVFVWPAIHVHWFTDHVIDILKLLYAWTGTCPPTWTFQSNTNVWNGQGNPASTVQDCQTACEIDIECTGFDYITGNIQGYRCWLSGPWSGTRNNRTAPGVTHYDINRNCSGMFYYC